MNEQQERNLQMLKDKYAGTKNGSLEYIAEIEKSLVTSMEEKRTAENPIFIAIFKDAEKKLNEINALLMNDRSLTEMQRALLFAQKDMWLFLFRRFKMEPHDNSIALLENIIETKLKE